jgi:small GTP-binding protein
MGESTADAKFFHHQLFTSRTMVTASPAVSALHPAGGSATDEALSVKVVLLGDSGVGKSSLVIRYVRGTFHPFQEPTIGAAFVSSTEIVDDGDDRRVVLKLWDTAGQERYHSLTPLYFRGAHVAILAFDICRLHSFRALQQWARQVTDHSPDILLVVVGTKSDLADHRSVSTQQAKEFCSNIGAVLYVETSAKDDDMVKELFQQVARRALQMIPADRHPSSSEGFGASGRIDPSMPAIDARPTVDLSATASDFSDSAKCCRSV